MKKISALFIFVVFANINLFAQWDPEYDFFTLKAGFNHSFLDAQPDSFAYYQIQNEYGDFQLMPVTGYMGYKLGFHGGLLFTHDMHNDLTGVSLGVEYQVFGMSQKYESLNKQYTLVDHQIINTVAIPLLFKVGKSMFKNQRYIFAGLQYNINLGMSQTSEVNFTTVVQNKKMKKDTYMRRNFVGVLGFNYTVFNFEANYVFGGFINKDYEVPMTYQKNPAVKLYDSFPDGLFVFKTSLTLPLNPWTTNSFYLIKRKLRRWLK